MVDAAEEDDPGSLFVLPHFVGAGPASTDIRKVLVRVCRELALRFGIADDIPEVYCLCLAVCAWLAVCL